MLEAEPESELECARAVSLCLNRAEIRRVAVDTAHSPRVCHLVVVEQVCEDDLEFTTESLSDAGRLPDLHVHVPERHAAENAAGSAVVACVNAQNWVAEAVQYLGRVREE